MRVFVTGMGVISPLGCSAHQTWQSAIEGRSGIRRITRFPVDDLATRIGGEICCLPEEATSKKLERRFDRATVFAITALEEALAGVGPHLIDDPRRSCVILGSGLSGLDTIHAQTDSLLEKGPKGVSPYTIPMLMPNASAAHIAQKLNVTGPAYCVSTACSSSAYALMDAAERIRSGEFDVAISGGTESSLTRLGLTAFNRMQAMATEANDSPASAVKPFDRHRQGLVMSEGAAILVLESEDHLSRRGGTALAELESWGRTTDSYHLLQPDPDGTAAAACIQEAMKNIGKPDELAATSYINAHGTATRLNDKAETRALKRAFGEASRRLQISSTKSMTGHLIGASAAVESWFCIQALREGLIPPTINYRDPDPECDLDYVPNTARPAQLERAFNLSFAFGGHNSCLVFRRV